MSVVILLSFRGFIERLRTAGLVVGIEEEVSVDYQIAKITNEIVDKKAVMFHKVTNPSGFKYGVKVISGICGDKERLKIGLKSEESLERTILNGLERPISPVIKGGFPWITKIENPNLRKILPIVRHYDCEPGPYITAGVIVSKIPGTETRTVSYHRMLLRGENRVTARIVEGRLLGEAFKKAESQNTPLDVLICLGLDAASLIASATPVKEIDKFSLAGGIKGRPLEVTVMGNGIEAPLSSEIVMEGRIIPNVRDKEGPFYEILGVDEERLQPVIEINRVYLRDEPIYYDILPAASEHETLMGVSIGALIYREVSKFARVTGVSMSPAGSGWIEVIIGIKKEFDGQPLQVGLAAITTHKSLKSVIIVDEDIDPNNYIQVMKSVNQRAYPPLDYHILSGAMGSTIEHSELRFVDINGLKLMRLPKSKIIIDATIKGPKKYFSRCGFPESV